MDTYYTIEEKYLQAIDELSYGERPKALQLLNEIVANDPKYARAHYLLGLLYYYTIEDYQTAGYHFKLCTELEPAFPDVYEHYLRLIIFLDMENMVPVIAARALNTRGVNAAAINSLLGLFAEKNKDWSTALAGYRKALLESVNKREKDDIEESIGRVKSKKSQVKKYNYLLSE